MNDSSSPDQPPDPTADTGRFQAFVDKVPDQRPPRVGVPFRVLTLLAGLLILGGLVWLLFLL